MHHLHDLTNRAFGAPRRFVLLSIPFFARRDDFVGQVGNLRPIVNRPVLLGGQSWLATSFRIHTQDKDHFAAWALTQAGWSFSEPALCLSDSARLNCAFGE
jgi:hypothetical protein